MKVVYGFVVSLLLLSAVVDAKDWQERMRDLPKMAVEHDSSEVRALPCHVLPLLSSCESAKDDALPQQTSTCKSAAVVGYAPVWIQEDSTSQSTTCLESPNIPMCW